jgi:hypothetical protein
MPMMDAEAATAEPMTSERVRAALRCLDAAIDRLEGRAGRLDAQAFRAYMALRQRRLALRLLLVARRVELTKRVVDFDRWRYGYRSAAEPQVGAAAVAPRS